MAAGGCHPTPAGRAAGCEVCVQGWFSGRLVPARATQEKNGSPALALAHYTPNFTQRESSSNYSHDERQESTLFYITYPYD